MIRRRFRSIIATGAAALVGGAMVAPGAPSASAAPPNATTTVRCESDSSGKAATGRLVSRRVGVVPVRPPVP
ncbi:hypothetical protein GP2_002_01170 [Gordonia paraffinivorans NBRC 108238]|uniref:Uncharacterized protein n=1 Tax=Gordonia paraffinivorans NBRC 108238 TaxID=1223543 RepID=A0ABQ0IFW1_9ACTN|nr:hypothetical protein GP2_002_01170 [Gordonia paraffinivorans NBRC 108238]